MAVKVTDNVFKIGRFSNSYLLLDEEPVLIDTSSKEDREILRRDVDGIVGCENVKFVLLTHLHYDHVSNLDLFSGAKVCLSSKEKEDLLRDPGLFFLERVSDKVVEMLRSAEILKKSFSGLDVIEVPGHTRGSVAFVDSKRGLLFSGDTLFYQGVGRSDFENSSLDKIWDSVSKLRGLVLEKGLKVCPGHDY